MTKEIKFTKDGTAFLSESFFLEVSGRCGIGLQMAASATLTLERSISGDLFDEVEDGQRTMEAGYHEFSVVNGVHGQWLRIRITAAPTGCLVLI